MPPFFLLIRNSLMNQVYNPVHNLTSCGMPRLSAIAEQRNEVHSILKYHCNMVVTGIVMDGVSMAIKGLVDDSDSSSDSEDEDSDFEYVRPGLSLDTLGILIEHLNQLYAKRYGAPRTRIPKSTHWRDHCVRQSSKPEKIHAAAISANFKGHLR